jgi:Coenzyme PQQ synthesis protein D (PqqD)
MAAALAPGVLAIPVADETVVWVEGTGALHLLDPVASATLDELLLADVETAATRLSERFGAPLATVYADVVRVAATLHDAGVLARPRA